ncbi:MAG: ATP-binding protein [Bacteroidales bacterium]|nr:ATP-binding protein [Bacteroidales bacterium]
MKRIAYHDRIAFSYIGATATLLALAFILIYLVVRMTVYANLDRTLHTVAEKHIWEVQVKEGKVSFINKIEWEEREHREVEVNPVFIELHGVDGQTMDKSPNLKVDSLGFHSSFKAGHHFNTLLRNQPVRQLKLPVIKDDKTVGYITTAIPIDGYLLVLKTLQNILLISFLFALLLLFLTARYLAIRSIRPVKVIIAKAQQINSSNLTDKIPVPETRDELYDLAVAINQLLDRIEEGLQREKQFTSDAAHQLKTPLAILKGSLEVMVRKPRKTEEYVTKIQESLLEIDRLSEIVDKLLVLARMDNNSKKIRVSEFSAIEAIDKVVQRAARLIESKSIRLVFEPQSDAQILSDPFLVDLILENLLSNALKFSSPFAVVEISCIIRASKAIVSVRDEGMGMDEKELGKIFQPFYRIENVQPHGEKGSGIGLSIVQKACRIASIPIFIESRVGRGTKVTIEIQAVTDGLELLKH